MAVRYDLSGDIERFARHPLGEVGPVRGPLRRALDMEWSAHRLLGDILGAALALGDDALCQSQRTRQEDELLADVACQMTSASEEQYPGEPFQPGKQNYA